jgi:hypothetical protein
VPLCKQFSFFFQALLASLAERSPSPYQPHHISQSSQLLEGLLCPHGQIAHFPLPLDLYGSVLLSDQELTPRVILAGF